MTTSCAFPTSIENYLEDHIASVVNASPLHITYQAYDRASALIATAALLARGHQAQLSCVSNHIRTAWLVHAAHI